MRRALVAALATVAVACPATPASTPTTPTPSASAPTPTPAVSTATPPASLSPRSTPGPTGLRSFDADRALALASELAAMGSRDAGTPGDAAARSWLAGHLAAAGWTVVEESFPLPQGGATANVIAVRESVDLDGPHVVVGGHLDTRDGSPGANDNGSGIGVLIAVAEALPVATAVPVVLVGFGAEEFQPAEPRVHHLGSEDYASRRAHDVVAAMVVDMVGNGPGTCICWFDAGPSTLADRLAAVADAAGLDGFNVESRGDLSDHGPFARRGVPAAFLWTYADGRLHTPDDTAEHLDVDDFQRAGALVVAFVHSLAAADVDGLRASP